MKDIFLTKKTRKIEADLSLKNGKLYYLEEDMTEEKPLEEIFKPFVGDFCKITISNEVKKDSITEDGSEDE